LQIISAGVGGRHSLVLSVAHLGVGLLSFSAHIMWPPEVLTGENLDFG